MKEASYSSNYICMNVCKPRHSSEYHCAVHTPQIILGMLLIIQYLLNLVLNVCFHCESSEGECLRMGEKWNQLIFF